MEFLLNNSPELAMADITKMLCNRNFLSDVQFHTAGGIIYAHSLELMKRSIVFQKQLVKTLGENKLVPITDISYDNVYQFVRFIYTDECDINNTNAFELLKLAKRYKVIKLENEIVRVTGGVEMNLKLYEYCLLENDQLHLRRSQLAVLNGLKVSVSTKVFLAIHPIVIEGILKSETINLTEFEIFKAVARWINQNSFDNNIEVHLQREHYDNIIKLIRFSVMSTDELFNCTAQYPHLFKDSDYVTFFKQIAQPCNNETKLWNTQKRELSQLYIWNIGSSATIFTVSCEMLLVGVRFGSDFQVNPAELVISQKHMKSNVEEKVKVNCKQEVYWWSHNVNLGESIRLQLNRQYSIKINYDESVAKSKIRLLRENVDIFTNISPNFIQFERVSKNIFEIYFELL